MQHNSLLYKKTKNFILFVSKYLGLFWLSQRITANTLRILCYHRFSDEEDAAWSPDMVISSSTLLARMRYLVKCGYLVIELDKAVSELETGSFPKNAVVITIDDGWYSTLSIAHPIISEFHFPYTIYVTGYYAKKQIPLFNHIVRFMFWKTDNRQFDLRSLQLPIFANAQNVIPADDENIEKIIDYGHMQLSSSERHQFAKKIGDFLGVPYNQLAHKRILNLLSSSEIQALAKAGVDIQLHSFRHRWPKDHTLAYKELVEDRIFLEPLAGKKLKHFCYPSGVWEPSLFPVLQAAGIKSATTCDNGLNHRGIHPFTLKRFLDHENVSQLEFEAELSGFLYLFRPLWYRLTRRVNP